MIEGFRCSPVGPLDAKIVIVGEAPGEEEERVGVPFVGPAGGLLNAFLAEAGIERAECYVTNVFKQRPPNNDLLSWCGSKKEVGGAAYPYPVYKAPGKYILPERATPALEELAEELSAIRPNLVIALGNTACWALLRTSGISALRGTINPCALVSGLKVLPSYHPAAILRAWDLKPIALMDFKKAAREARFREIQIPSRWICATPSRADLDWFWWRWLQRAQIISVDIETEKNTITCIGFSPSPTVSLVIPFFDKTKEGWHYWEKAEDERAAWLLVRRILESPSRKLFQNGLYDLQYLWRVAKIATNMGDGGGEDTMLLHHSLQPELQKSLGFMGSVYCNAPAWKGMLAASRRIKAKDVDKDDL